MMQIKITTNEGNTNRIGEHDCSTGFTSLKEAIEFINTYGDPHKTYILTITVSDNTTRTIPDDLDFKKNIKIIGPPVQPLIQLTGAITVDIDVHVTFQDLIAQNMEVHYTRIRTYDFEPLIEIQPGSRTVTDNPPTTTTTTTTTSSATAHTETLTPPDMEQLIQNAPPGTIYVKTDGNDYNNGLTPTTSKKTIQNAINTAPNEGMVIVYPGSYDENLIINKNLILQGFNVFINGLQKNSVITCTQGTITITGFTIVNGNNTKGGGIYNNTNLTLIKCKISLNTAKWGGGIYNNGTLYITDTKIFVNKATKNGGGIYTTNTLHTHQIEINSNNAIENGGGIYHHTGNIYIDLSEIHANTSRKGGGIYANAPSKILTTKIYSNTADTHGGGIYNASETKIDSSYLQNNGTGKEGSGGAIYNAGLLTITTETTFMLNISGLNGGAIFNNTTASLFVFSANFLSNSGFDGGAIYNNSFIKLDNASYVGNTARHDGGAIFIDTNGFIQFCPIKKGVAFFDKNLAYNQGGAIYNHGEIQLKNVDKGKNYPDFITKR